jgi:oligoribonuclease (3'-5' exoribonuclease)
MNARILKRIADQGERTTTLNVALFNLKCWMNTIEWGSKRGPHPVGFNVAAFDVAFIKAAGGFTDSFFHYRPVELGSLLSPNGFPITSNRAVRDILGRDIKHDALQDARDVVELHRHWMASR